LERRRWSNGSPGSGCIAGADVAYEASGAVERSRRLAAVAAMIYLVINARYSAGAGEVAARAPLCDAAIRLTRLLQPLFQAEQEIMGLAALFLQQHARARFDANGAIILLEDQARILWDRKMIAKGLP
jgi:RNA polymerase sigma-70 factor (ECF subfamily)